MVETKQETGDTADNNASLKSNSGEKSQDKTPMMESKQTKFEGHQVQLGRTDQMTGKPILWFHIGAEVKSLAIGDKISIKADKTYRGSVVRTLSNTYVALSVK